MSIFAVDIEHSGFNILSIGAVVVDKFGSIVHEFHATCYNKDTTRFSPRCWSEFWSKQPAALESMSKCRLKYDSISDLVRGFYEFYVDVWHDDLTFVSDNPSFDIGEINAELKCLGFKSLLYDSNGKYHTIVDVFSLQHGIILSLNDGSCPNWNRSAFIRENYADVDRYPNPVHDHNPVNDAHSIAIDYLLCLDASSGVSSSVIENIDNVLNASYFREYKSFFEYVKKFPYNDDIFKHGQSIINPTLKDITAKNVNGEIVVKICGVPIENLNSYKQWKIECST